MSPLSPFLMHVAGLFVREAGELPEMMYQWRAPFVLDDSDFSARFDARPTAIDSAVAATVAWARERWDVTAAA